MRDDYGFTSLSTISEKKSADSELIMMDILPASFFILLKRTVPSSSSRLFLLGKTHSGAESIKMGIVDELYKCEKKRNPHTSAL